MKAVLRTRTFITSLVMILLFSAGVAVAQTSSSRATQTPSPPPRADGQNEPETPLSTFEEDLRVKRELALAEKEHKENLDRAREISQIGKELQESLRDKTVIDHESLKKVERLEKLTRKIRGEAGGEDEDVTIIHRPTDVSGAVAQIAEASESLSKNVQNTPRRVVSASVIGNANVLLELIKILRGFVH
jgi:hypothetical protein